MQIREELKSVEVFERLYEQMQTLADSGEIGEIERALGGLCDELERRSADGLSEDGGKLFVGQVLLVMDGLLTMLGQLAREFNSVRRDRLLDVHLYFHERRQLHFLKQIPSADELCAEIREVASLVTALRLELKYRLPHEPALRHPPMPAERVGEEPLLIPGFDPWIYGKVIEGLDGVKESFAAGNGQNGTGPDDLRFVWLAELLAMPPDTLCQTTSDYGEGPLDTFSLKDSWLSSPGQGVVGFRISHLRNYRSLRKALSDMLGVVAGKARAIGSSLERTACELRDQVPVDGAMEDAVDFVRRLKELLKDAWLEIVLNRPLSSGSGVRTGGAAKPGRKMSYVCEQQVERGLTMVKGTAGLSVNAAAHKVIENWALAHPETAKDGYSADKRGVNSLAQAIGRARNRDRSSL